MMCVALVMRSLAGEKMKRLGSPLLSTRHLVTSPYRKLSERRLPSTCAFTEVDDVHHTRHIRYLQVRRTFTEVGFATAPIPDPIWASISTYYHNNRLNVTVARRGN